MKLCPETASSRNSGDDNLIPLINVSEGYRSLPLTIMGALILLFSVGHIIRVLIGRDERADSIE